MKNCPAVLLACLFLVFLVPQIARPAEQKVKSKVTAVTVYSDRALITRTTRQYLRAGTQTLLFEGLPDALVDESIKVAGESETQAKIVDVKVEETFLDTIPEARANEIAARISDLRAKKNGLDTKRLVVMAQINTVDSIRANYARSLAGSNPGQKAMTEEWEKLLNFIGKKKTEYNDRIEDFQRQTEVLLRQIGAAEKELQDINGQTRMSVKTLTVVLSMQRPDSILINVSYIIPQAQWSPMYEARISASDSLLQLVYTGQVSQSTGEDWKDIDLVLSTAQPALGIIPPPLQPWYVDFQPPVYVPPYQPAYALPQSRSSSRQTTPRANTISGKVLDGSTMEPLAGANVNLEGTGFGAATDLNGQFTIYNVPPGTYNAKATYVGYASTSINGIQVAGRTGAAEMFYLSPSSIQVNAVEIAAERPMVMKNATTSSVARSVEMEQSHVSTQAALTAAVFHIASRQSIPTDGQMHKVGIAIENLPVSFNYESSPKIVPATYLQAKGRNTTDYPFLRGPVSVFYENAFIATSRIPTIVPNDTFAVSCGIDEGIRVERKLVRKFTEEVGTFTKRIRVTYEYEILVNNLRKRDVTLTLNDQIPVSRNEDVTVKVLEPTEDQLKPRADGTFTWLLKLVPDSKRTVNLKFYVEYPRDRSPFGLE